MTQQSEIATLTEQPKLEREVKELATTAMDWLVVDQASFTHAGQMLQGIRLYTKKVHDVFDPIVEANHKAHKVAVDQRKNMLAPVENAERVLKERMGDYEQAQQRLAEIAEQERRREQERLEEEARQEALKIEAENRRQAEEATLAVAIQAEEQGDTEAAEQILEQPVFVPPVAPRPVFAPPVQVMVPQATGVSFRSVWSAEVTDLKTLVLAIAAGKAPLAAVMADMTVLNGLARSLKGSMNVPGVRATEKKSAAVRI
jgi:hypothetical protein